MRRRTVVSLRVRLLALVGVVVMLALAFIVQTSRNERARLAAQAQDEAIRLVHLLGTEQQQQISDVRQLLFTLAQMPQVRDSSHAECAEFLAHVLKLNPAYANFGIVALDGTNVCSAISGTQPVYVGDRSYFQRTMESGEFAVGDYQVGRISGKPTLACGYPLQHERGGIRGVLYAALDLEWLNRRWSDVHLPEGAVLTVLDSRGTVLVRSLDPEKWVGQSVSNFPVVKLVFSKIAGGFEAIGLDGVARFHAFMRLPGTTAMLMVGIPTSVVYAEAERTLRWNLEIFGVVALLAFAGAGFIGEWLVLRRLQRLVEATRQLTAGDWATRSGIALDKDEIGQLGDAFDQMAGTLQKQLAALKEREAQFRDLFEGSPDAVFVESATGIVLDVNPAACRLHGAARHELVGRQVLDLTPPEHRAAVQREFPRWFNNELTYYEGFAYTKDQRSIPVEIRGARIDYQGQPAVLLHVRDATERQQLEERVRQSQKMEAVGQLAGGVAHDFNNILTAILGYGELLDALVKDHPQARQHVAQIRNAGEQAAQLTRQLLAFGRRQALQPRVININGIVADMTGMLRRLIGENIDLSLRTDPAVGNVRIDPSQLQQVILNLAVNGRDAMIHEGQLTLETANVTLDASYTLQHAEVLPGQYVMLAITDTGIGVGPDVKAHLFEPFFTTKEQGKGTGLGLATCYGIVKQSGGHIAVYSEVGHGTTIKVYLPRVDQPAEVLPARANNSDGHHGSETVFVVEDEPAVRELVVCCLREFGYTVHEASNGQEALRLLEIMPADVPQLLITDVIMPHMGGRELAERFHTLRPATKVLFTSGYTQDAIVSHGELDPGIAFLQKPFTTAALAEKIREILDHPRPA